MRERGVSKGTVSHLDQPQPNTDRFCRAGASNSWSRETRPTPLATARKDPPLSGGQTVEDMLEMPSDKGYERLLPR